MHKYDNLLGKKEEKCFVLGIPKYVYSKRVYGLGTTVQSKNDNEKQTTKDRYFNNYTAMHFGHFWLSGNTHNTHTDCL